MELFDSWLGRGGVFLTVGSALRWGFWLWRRRSGAAVPFFGVIGRAVMIATLLFIMTLRYQTAKAKNAQLARILREAGIPVPPEFEIASGDSSFALPGSTLLQLQKKNGAPLRSTSGLPENLRE